ncbi:Glutathione hydrolase 2 [Camellia lanceoleosa]|nr:Glutathione hydrolase 2 [Camellia lanceoleosa]
MENSITIFSIIDGDQCFRRRPFLPLATFSSSVRPEVSTAHCGVVAADDGRCSRIGRDVLREGGHAVDASVAVALCLGVVSPASSGIGGGAFMLLRLANGTTEAFDMRETAPMKASKVEKNFADVVFSFLHYIKQSYLSGLGPRQLIQVLFMVLFHQLSSLVFICMTTS